PDHDAREDPPKACLQVARRRHRGDALDVLPERCVRGRDGDDRGLERASGNGHEQSTSWVCRRPCRISGTLHETGPALRLATCGRATRRQGRTGGTDVGRVACRVRCYADGMRMQVPGPRSDRRIDPGTGYLAEGAEGESEASFARTSDASSHCRPTLGESIVAGRRPVRIRGGPDTRTRSTNLIPVARSDGPVRPRNRV